MKRIFTYNGRVCIAEKTINAMDYFDAAIGVFDITDGLKGVFDELQQEVADLLMEKQALAETAEDATIVNADLAERLEDAQMTVSVMRDTHAELVRTCQDLRRALEEAGRNTFDPVTDIDLRAGEAWLKNSESCGVEIDPPMVMPATPDVTPSVQPGDIVDEGGFPVAGLAQAVADHLQENPAASLSGGRIGDRRKSPQMKAIDEIVKRYYPTEMPQSEIHARILAEVPDAPEWIAKTSKSVSTIAVKLGVKRPSWTTEPAEKVEPAQEPIVAPPAQAIVTAPPPAPVITPASSPAYRPVNFERADPDKSVGELVRMYGQYVESGLKRGKSFDQIAKEMTAHLPRNFTRADVKAMADDMELS